MIFIREGRKYDTETSTLIYEHVTSSEHSLGYTETLYRSAKNNHYAIREEEEGANTTYDIKFLPKKDVSIWLDKRNAPESAYAACDIEIEEA